MSGEWSPDSRTDTHEPRIYTPDTLPYSSADIRYSIPETNPRGLTVDETVFIRALVEHRIGLLNSPDSNIRVPIEIPHNKLLLPAFDSVSVTSLEERGYIKRHQIGNLGSWYSVTPIGQAAVGLSNTSGVGVGDPGEDMPHRVIVEIVARYLSGFTDVKTVKKYDAVPVDGKQDERIDITAHNAAGNLLYVVEVEAGTSRNRRDGRVATNDAREVEKDWIQMRRLVERSDADAEAWWVCQSFQVATRILGHMQQRSLIEWDSIPTAGFPRLREEIDFFAPLGYPGMHRIVGFSEVWGALDAGESLF